MTLVASEHSHGKNIQKPAMSAMNKSVVTIHMQSRKETFSGLITRNSSGDEIANVNFLYDDIVSAIKIQ